MKKNIVYALMILVLAFASNAFAITEATGVSGTGTMLTSIDGDWTMAIAERVTSIVFVPGAANDELVIKDGLDTGIVKAQLTSGDGEPRIVYFSEERFAPMLDFSAGTFTAGAYVVINYKR